LLLELAEELPSRHDSHGEGAGHHPEPLEAHGHVRPPEVLRGLRARGRDRGGPAHGPRAGRAPAAAASAARGVARRPASCGSANIRGQNLPSSVARKETGMPPARKPPAGGEPPVGPSNGPDSEYGPRKLIRPSLADIRHTPGGGSRG